MTEHVPREFRCPECGFVVVKSIINPEGGFVGRDSADRLEPCPNDGAILRPIRWEDALEEARGEAVKIAQSEWRLRELVGRASQAMREACRLLPDHENIFFPGEVEDCHESAVIPGSNNDFACQAGAKAKNILLNLLVELP